jgi:hypothetical protein
MEALIRGDWQEMTRFEVLHELLLWACPESRRAYRRIGRWSVWKGSGLGGSCPPARQSND